MLLLSSIKAFEMYLLKSKEEQENYAYHGYRKACGV